MKHLQCVEAVERLARPVGNARRSWDERRGLALLFCGAWGTAMGEATPLPGHSPEPYQLVARLLSQFVAPRALPADSERSALISWLEAFHSAHPELPASARCALDSCLLDAASRCAGVALCEWLAPGAAVREFERCQLFDLWSAEQAEPAYRSPVARTLKVKLGKQPTAELEQLRRLKARWPTRRLRADANQSLPPEACLNVLHALGELSIEFLEEPCPLSELGPARPLPCPLALDESLLREPELARRWLRSGHVAAVVLKPMLLGSLARTLQWVELARSVGATVIFSHLFDGSIAARLYEHLARAFGTPGVAAGLGPHPGLQLFAARVTPDAHGLGLGLSWTG